MKKFDSNMIMFDIDACKERALFQSLLEVCFMLDYKFACSPKENGGFFIECSSKACFIKDIEENMPMDNDTKSDLIDMVDYDGVEVCGDMCLSYVVAKISCEGSGCCQYATWAIYLQ